jgi:hypothetical protein
LPDKEFATKVAFQLTHLMAHRRGRDAQLIAGHAETFGPSSRLEGVQQRKLWNTAHSAILDELYSCFYEKSSLVNHALSRHHCKLLSAALRKPMSAVLDDHKQTSHMSAPLNLGDKRVSIYQPEQEGLIFPQLPEFKEPRRSPPTWQRAFGGGLSCLCPGRV